MNIKDVAKEAGVSISTVSRVINGTAKVNEETRLKVEAVIKRTNYRPNSLARELQQNKTNTIGVLISVEQLNMSSLSESINAISDVLNQKGYRIMLANSRFDSDEEINFFKVFQEKRVDGILYFASGITEKHLDILANYPIPIVTIGQQINSMNIPCVIHDDYEAARKATEYLIEKGHSKISYISCPSYDEAAGNKRKEGFYNAMISNGLNIQKDYVTEGDFSLDSGYRSMELLMKTKEQPTAVFAGTDYMAIGAIRYLMDHGYKVPEDISVIGFDDVNIADFYIPRLTTIHTNKKSVGTVAAKLLLKIMNHDNIDIHKYTADFELIERESVMKIDI